jgi:hypothetical protein
VKKDSQLTFRVHGDVPDRLKAVGLIKEWTPSQVARRALEIGLRELEREVKITPAVEVAPTPGVV